jgi:hypothetical protein
MIGTANYRSLIDEVSAKYNIPSDVFEAMILVESNGNPKDVSASNAIGLGQIIYKWHKDTVDDVTKGKYGRESREDDLYDPYVNLTVSAIHLSWCYRSDGSQSWERAVRKYFSGSADPAPGFTDGQGTTPEQHITKLLKAIVTVQNDRKEHDVTVVNTYGLRKVYPLGLVGGMYLPAKITFKQTVIPDSMIGWVRSGERVTKTRGYWHDTGNPGSDAGDEAGYLRGGPLDKYGKKYKVGYNGAVDDKTFHAICPFNESTWAQGRDYENDIGYAIEQCFGGTIGWDASFDNTCWVHASILYALGRDPAKDLRQHNEVYGKDCPSQVRHKGLWPVAINRTVQYYNIIKAFDLGEVQPEPPVTGWPYPKPVVPDFWEALMSGTPYVKSGGTLWYRANVHYRVKKDDGKGTHRLQYAIEGGQEVGPVLDEGQDFTGEAVGQSAMDGRAYTITQGLTRVALDDLEVVEEA